MKIRGVRLNRGSRKRRLRPRVHPSSLIPHPLKVAAHGVESGLNRLDGGGEGETQVPLAVLAEDYAGDCRDVRAFEQDVCGGAAVFADARNVREGVESSVRRVAREVEFVESGDDDVAALAVCASNLRVKVRGESEGRECP